MDIVSLILAKAICGGSEDAKDISYDNSQSAGLISTNVNDALDELSTKLGVKMVTVSELPIIGEENILYIVPKSTPEQGNYSDEYTWNVTRQDYDKVGDTLISPLPDVTSSDNGKVLGVVNGEWDKYTVPKELPTVSSSDNGKVLSVVSSSWNKKSLTKSDIGLGNVDNTSDLNKPISTATQSALDTKLSEDDLYNMTEDSTVSGNPVTLKTLAKTSAKSCEVTFSPIQDLHGQSNPYPAGGGKNKFDGNFPNISQTVQYVELDVGDGTFIISTTCPKNSDNAANLFFTNSTSTPSTNANGVWNGQSRTVTSNNGKVYLWYRQTVNTNPEDYNTQIELGSTATDYAPYENICPISGRDSLSLNVSGINQLDNSLFVNDKWLENTGAISNYEGRKTIVSFLPIGIIKTFWFGAFLDGAIREGDYNIKIATYSSDSESSFIRSVSSGINGHTFSFSDNEKYFRIGVTRNDFNVAMNYPTTATSYEPYQGSTHTATFSDTVYGGSHEFVSGKATSLYGSILLKNVEWTYNSGSLRFDANAPVPNIKPPTSGSAIFDGYCEILKVSANSGLASGQISSSNGGYLRIKLDGVTTTEGLLEILGDYKLVYALNTPTEITLTPETIALLKGNNTLWTDGDNVEIIYEKLDLTELPDVTSADEGKVLTVNSSGDWIASTLPDGTNISY